MIEELFVRRDDSEEVVKKTGQNRSPNGFVYFEFVLPEHHRGETGELTHDKFNAAYKPRYEPAPQPPKKPTSAGSAAEWRAWALFLEGKLKEAEAQYQRAQRDNPGWW